MASELEVGKVKVGTEGFTPHASVDDLTIAPSDAAAGLTIRAGSNSGTSRVAFADLASTTVGLITYDHNTDNLTLAADDDVVLSSGAGTGSLNLDATGETKITRDGDEPCLELATNNAGCKLLFARSGDPTAYIRMYEDGAVGTGSLRFATGSSATPVERLTINSSGLATFSAGVVTSEKGIISGSVTVADNAVTTITPQRKGGFIHILADTTAGDGGYPVKSDSAQIWFDCGSSLNIEKLDVGTVIGSQVETTISNLTGTTGTDGRVTVGTQSGVIQIENRQNATRVFNYTIIC